MSRGEAFAKIIVDYSKKKKISKHYYRGSIKTDYFFLVILKSKHPSPCMMRGQSAEPVRRQRVKKTIVKR